MKKILLALVSSLGLIIAIHTFAFAGFTFQDFEPDNGSNPYGWHMGSIMYTWSDLASAPEPVHSGARSWKLITDHYTYWAQTGIGSQVNPGDTNLNLSRNDRLLIWIYSIPQWGGHHTLGVTLFDNGIYANQGFQIWTTNVAIYRQWTPLYILLSQLPSNFDLQHINRIVATMYWPGTYYFDDVTVLRQDRAYQTFEPSLRGNPGPNEFGWKWNDADTVGFGSYPEPVKEGGNSWKLTTANKWGGTGIQSQEKGIYWDENLSRYEQSFWHVNLNPQKNSNLVFWVHQNAQNQMDNNLGVQFYDQNQHHTDNTKAVFWPSKACRWASWSRVVIPFSKLPSTLNLSEIDKIQLQQYWPGTNYFDDIRATGKLLKIKETNLTQGVVAWDAIPEAAKYILEESRVGADGPWDSVYSGTATTFNVKKLTKLWYRVRWEEPATTDNPIPYISDYSDIVQYTPRAIFIKKDRLSYGYVEWQSIPAANQYEVQSSQNPDGPWNHTYSGPYRTNIRGTNGTWYRVRAMQTNNNQTVCMTNWSKPQAYEYAKGFLRAVGTTIKDRDGQGKEVLLQGVNLGSLFLIENWMTGIGEADTPPIEDEWTIRDVLYQRFGGKGAQQLLNTYYNAYIKAVDFDRLFELGVNTVRVPLYYRALQNERYKFGRYDSSYAFDFSNLDRIINYCAERGIYVLLDLHGAPGSQSPEFHTGRKDFNKLFENSREGEMYRKQTIDVWQAIVKHYKDNTTVCGFDLLNEPTGAPSNQALWDLYNRIYQAIRKIDKNHIIMMEAIWDWNTLPIPSAMGWKNVAYQFHYYLWDSYEDVAAHTQYIDQKVTENRIQQPLYNVPIMIGEFNAFGFRQMWEHYLQNFNQEKYSWTMWNYKMRHSPSEWGLYNHANYGLELPKLRTDSFNTLGMKLARYATSDYHVPNYSLSELIANYALAPTDKPFIKTISPETQRAQFEITITGKNFGNTPGTVLYEGATMPLISWSDTQVRFYVPYTVNIPCGMICVRVGNETSNETVLHVI